jgi:drug/metabolite transporter (DMT)-like permease
VTEGVDLSPCDDLKRAASYALRSAAAFAIMGIFIKAASAKAPNEVVVFFRNLVSMLTLLPILMRGGLRATLATQRPWGHVLRTSFGLGSMYCFFFAISQLPLASAMLLTYSTPLYVPFIAWIWLKERPDAIVFPCAVLGLVGIALIVKPGAGMFSGAGALFGVAAGVFAAFAMVTVRSISDTEPATRIVFYLAALGTVISAVPLTWAWETPDARTFAFLVLSGVLATVGQVNLTSAYAWAPAARVGPFSYTSVIFSAFLAWLIWGEGLDRWSMLGIAIVVATCVLAGWRRREPLMEE